MWKRMLSDVWFSTAKLIHSPQIIVERMSRTVRAMRVISRIFIIYAFVVRMLSISMSIVALRCSSLNRSMPA